MRKPSFILLLVTLIALITFDASADEVKKGQSHVNIIEEIQTGSEGNITINVSDDIHGLIDYYIAPEKKTTNTQPQKKKEVPKKQVKPNNQGWRIQVFCDGSDQRTLKVRAQSRAGAVASRFPQYRGQVYTFSRAPKWYCQVGNFTSEAQARSALAQLKGAFPQYAGEFRLVKTTISIH